MSSVLKLITVIDMFYGGTETYPWRATAVLEGQSVRGLVNIQIWADTSAAAIGDLMLVLDSYGIETDSAMHLQLDGRSAEVPVSEPSLAGQASERGWTFHVVEYIDADGF